MELREEINKIENIHITEKLKKSKLIFEMINKIYKPWKASKGKTPQFINIEYANWIINTDLLDIKHTKKEILWVTLGQ